jgi:hypothetical protein
VTIVGVLCAFFVACLHGKFIRYEELMNSITGMHNGAFGEMGLIPNHLKNKTIDCGYNPFYLQGDEGSKITTIKLIIFNLRLKWIKFLLVKVNFLVTYST